MTHLPKVIHSCRHGTFVMASCWNPKNATALGPYAHGLANRAARLTFVQEHSIPAYEINDYKYTFKHGSGKNILLGPLVPGADRTGGVGAIASTEDSLFAFPAITDEFKHMIDTGRVLHFGFCCSKGGSVISVFNVYSISGSAQNRRKSCSH